MMPHGERRTARSPRLATWWKGPVEPVFAAPVPPASPPAGKATIAELRRDAERELMQRIVAFLDRHDLSPTAEHLLAARSYVTGENLTLIEAVDMQVATQGRISAGFLDTLAPQSATDRLSPAALGEMADTLGATLADSCTTIGQSRDTARALETALGDAIQGMAGDPRGSVERLVTITAAAVERTQDLAAQLDAMGRETTRLRSRLQVARCAAEQDHLTRLPNRRSFDARIARTPDDPQRCVALCDIDDFKAINDRHGHDVGDRVLKVVARHLKSALGGAVMVARHGGEEFACLFEGASLHAARTALDTARDQLSERRFVNQENGTAIGQVTLSIGVAVLADNPRAAMRAADAALYAAKRAGKNRVVVAGKEYGD